MIIAAIEQKPILALKEWTEYYSEVDSLYLRHRLSLWFMSKYKLYALWVSHILALKIFGFSILNIEFLASVRKVTAIEFYSNQWNF